MTFKEWFDIKCKKQPHKYGKSDSEYDKLKLAYEAGRKQGYKEAEEDFEEEELTRHINASFRGEV